MLPEVVPDVNINTALTPMGPLNFTVSNLELDTIFVGKNVEPIRFQQLQFIARDV